MTTRRLHPAGFTLLEVMFAVVVLMLGMIFVASQFPAGLYLSRQIVDATTESLEGQNTAAMMALELDQVAAYTPPGGGTQISFVGPASTDVFCTTGKQVYFLNRANIMADSLNDTNKDVVIDEPTNRYFYSPKEPSSPFEYNKSIPGYYVLEDRTATLSEMRPQSLGMFTVPMVGKYDESIDKKRREEYPDYDDFRNNYSADQQANAYDRWMFDEILNNRDYNWILLYRYLNDKTDPDPADPFTLEFICLKIRQKPTDRYGMYEEDPSATDPTATKTPKSLADDQDRWLAVPWKIELNTAINPSDIGSYPTHQFPDPEFTDRFLLNDYTNSTTDVLHIVSILREGTPLIDVDHGQIYTVVSLVENADNPDDWYIRLDRRLEAKDGSGALLTYQRFWIVPPPITNHTSSGPDEFADEQPVVDITRTVITYN